MIYDYVVTLRNDRKRSVDIISILVLLISGFCFLNVLVHATRLALIFPAAVLLLLAAFVFSWYRKKQNKRVRFSIPLVVAGVTWFAMPYLPWIGMPVLLLALLEKPAKQ